MNLMRRILDGITWSALHAHVDFRFQLLVDARSLFDYRGTLNERNRCDLALKLPQIHSFENIIS